MIGLLRRRLKPYRRQIGLILVLLLVQAFANLYLPTLNADIINNGVVAGDTAYIVRTGAVMLGVTLLFVLVAIIAVYWSSRVSMGFGRDVRGALFRRVQSFSQAEVNRFGTPSLITRTTNDVQQVQMAVLMMLNVAVAAPIMSIGGVVMALRLNVPLSTVILVAIPVMALFIGLVLRAGAAPLQVHAGQARPHQSGDAGEAERRAGDPRLRPHGVRGAALRRRQRGPHCDEPQGQSALRAHDADAHGDPQSLDGRHHVVREHPGRRAAACRSATSRPS